MSEVPLYVLHSLDSGSVIELVGVEFEEPMPHTTRWTTNFSSQVNLPHASDFRVQIWSRDPQNLCGSVVKLVGVELEELVARNDPVSVRVDAPWFDFVWGLDFVSMCLILLNFVSLGFGIWGLGSGVWSVGLGVVWVCLILSDLGLRFGIGGVPIISSQSSWDTSTPRACG